MMKVERIHDFCLANDSIDGYLGAADACPKTCCKCMEKPEPCNRLYPAEYDNGEMCSMKGVSFSGKATLKQECPQTCGICPSDNMFDIAWSVCVPQIRWINNMIEWQMWRMSYVTIPYICDIVLFWHDFLSCRYGSFGRNGVSFNWRLVCDVCFCFLIVLFL
jgi:hypothetical protein